MAFSLSDLLNPAPASGAATPTHEGDAAKYSHPRARTLAEFANDLRISPTATTSPTYGTFAPELFAGNDAPTIGTNLAALAADATDALESSTIAFEQGNPAATVAPTLLKQETTEEASEYPMEGLEEPAGTQQSQDDDADAQPIAKHKEKKYKSKRTDLDKDGPERSHVHSSKNEGQHTNKRYLCYICNKLFTRRRSVRDHINKIHSVKTWEPQRSLEVTVDPNSGEPLEALDEVVARGPPPAPDKTPKKEKPPKLEKQDTIEEEPDEEDVLLASLRETQARAETETAEPESQPKTELPAWDEEFSLPALAEASAPPPPVIGKKRPAPDTMKPLPAAATKKGIARPNKGTPNKKPKLSHTESISDKGTPFPLTQCDTSLSGKNTRIQA